MKKMAKVEISITEWQALRELGESSKTSVPIGYIVGSFLIKAEKILKQEQEKELKKRYTDEA